MVAYSPSLPRRGIVAASARLNKPGTKLAPTAEWQADAWNAYDVTGQGRYVANAVANAISRCGLYIAKLDPDTGEILGPAEEQRLRPLTASPLGTGPKRRENLRLAGLNLFVGGEFYLIGEAGAEGAGRDRWYLVSSFDFDRSSANGTKVFKCTRPQMAGGGLATLVPKRDVITRVWTPHPKHATEADSPFRAALSDLNILSTIRKREAAELDSRLTGAGIMLWPQSVDFGKEGITGFTDDLVQAASEIINDPAHPNSLVPKMVTMNGDDIEKVRVINFWSDLSDALASLTERKVQSLAQSLDAPIEMTLGTTGESNHWTAWLVSEDTITTHYEPILSRIADALTTVYLHPGIEKIGGFNPDEYAYTFDTSPLRVRGDRLGDDLNLYDRGLISGDSVRTTAGKTEDDAPDAKESTQRLMRELVIAHPELITDPQVAALLGWSGTAAPVIIDAERTTETPAPEVDQPPRESADLPDQSGANPPAAEDRPALTASAGGVAAVANEAVQNALRVAGGRLAKRWPADADRARLHTTLTATPDVNQVHSALRGVWDSLPDSIASLEGIDPDALTHALNTYTTELIRRRRPHDPAALAALLDLGGLA